MQFPKLWLSEEGSAVADFVMVVVPTSILLLPLLSLFGIMHSQLVEGQIAYEIARFSALADVNSELQGAYLQKLSPEANLRVDKDAGCLTVVSISRPASIFLWPYPIELTVNAKAQCENW